MKNLARWILFGGLPYGREFLVLTYAFLITFPCWIAAYAISAFAPVYFFSIGNTLIGLGMPSIFHGYLHFKFDAAVLAACGALMVFVATADAMVTPLQWFDSAALGTFFIVVSVADRFARR